MTDDKQPHADAAKDAKTNAKATAPASGGGATSGGGGGGEKVTIKLTAPYRHYRKGMTMTVTPDELKTFPASAYQRLS